MKFKSLLLATLCFSLMNLSDQRAFAGTAFPLPQDVLTLDELAGDWKSRGELEQFPSLHNFRSELLVNKDFASVSWVASPPFSQGFHSGVLRLDGKVPVAEKFRWYPYQSIRAGTTAGVAI